MNVQSLRFVGTLEGISFLLLLGIAMPIKYIWGINFRKIRWDGAWCFIHTLLVMLFVVCHRMKWSLSVFNMGLIAAILPFGPFIFDRKIKQLAEKDIPIALAE